ncbi:amino acid adenylation domain-containing protein, partial [Nocardia cyriacigeorgica]
LLALSTVAQAVVLVRDDHGTGAQLVAYLVPDGAVDVDGVRAELARVLPGYMIPTGFVVLDAFPVNASGKLDRKALPAPVFAPIEFLAPEGTT